MAIHVQIDPLERTATLRGVHSLCAGESSEVVLSGVPDADTPTLSLRVYRDASESVQVACSVRPGTDPVEEGLAPVEGRAALRRGTLDLRTSAVSEWAEEDAAAAAAAEEARRSGSKEPEARAAASYRRPDSAWLVVADSSRVWAACAVPFVLRPFDDALSPDPEVPLPSYAERAEAAAEAAEAAAERAEQAAEDAESAESVGKVGRDELFDDPDSASPKVKASLLPSYVDDVLEVAELPQSGESGKLYVVTGTNAVYRWSGSSFVEVSPSRDWSGELAAKRGLTDFSVGDGWILVKPGGAPVWMASRGDSDIWVGDDELEPSLTRDSGPLGEAWIFEIGPQASGERVRLEIPYSEVPVDSAVIVVNVEESTYFDGVYRLVRGSRLALDTEIPLADSAVTRTSANPVKSSGIWSAIWGALTALPTGVASLYEWCVAQLAGKLNTDGYTSWSITYPVSGYELLSCNWNRRIGASGGWAVELLNVSSGEKETFTVSGAKTITEIVVPSEDPMHPLFSLVREKMCKTKTSELTNDGDGDSPFATVSQIPDISGKADAADLRYRIAEAEYSASVGTAGGYILADRAVNLITATDETSIDIELPEAVTVDGVRRARDFLLDVDNFANASDLALEFTGLGVDYAFVPPEDDSISEMMTIGSGDRVRLYFTETPYHATGSLPVINVACVTLGDFVTSTATQGGNS